MGEGCNFFSPSPGSHRFRSLLSSLLPYTVFAPSIFEFAPTKSSSLPDEVKSICSRMKSISHNLKSATAILKFVDYLSSVWDLGVYFG